MARGSSPISSKEKSAAVSEIHFAGLTIACAGEGAALVAEQFVFDETFGNGRAIQRDERQIAARRKMMDGAGEKFFARAAFAE